MGGPHGRAEQISLPIGPAESPDKHTPSKALDHLRRDPIEPQLRPSEHSELPGVVNAARGEMDEPADPGYTGS